MIRRNLVQILLATVWICFTILLVVVLLMVRWYNLNLRPVDRHRSEPQAFVINRGATLDTIASDLKTNNLIRNVTAFKWHVRLNNQADNFKAGTFDLNKTLYVSEIIEILSTGLGTSVQVTIYPQKRLDQITDSLVNQGFKERDIQTALQLDHYQNHPLLTKGIIPADATLEGYLAPETFAVDQFNVESAKGLIRQSLDAFLENLTPDIQTGILQNFDSIHQGVTLASIVEQEVGSADRPTVAQVFIKRFKEGMRLGSDVTFLYAHAINDGPAHPNNPSPYNTRLHKGLPPGPISNVSLASLQAVAAPTDTDYLYFLSGDDGVTYFNETYEEHLADRDAHCDENCKLPPAAE